MASTPPSLTQPAWMSLWDKYFAPGDLRRRNQHSQQLQTPPPPPPQTITRPPRIDSARRARIQNGLLFGGLGFTLLSLLVTRRSLRRKYVQTTPATFTPNSAPQKVDGAFEAVEALNIATLNVLSFAVLSVGAVAKYFDIADVEDLREMYRRSAGLDVAMGESEADKEIEGWVAEVLARKDGQGGIRESVAERLAELKRRDEEAARLGKGSR